MTPQERFVVTSLCVIVFMGTMVNIGLQKDLRVFDWLHTAQRKAFMGQVNINKAGSEELLRIPGIGPKTAQYILQYRQKNGLFINLEPLQKAWGMTPERYERIIKYLKV